MAGRWLILFFALTLRVALATEATLVPLTSFLQALPAPMLATPTFVYRSSSLQGASLESPRGLLSADDSNLIVAFNGDPGQRGYGQLEVMEFDEAKAAFSFYELSVGPDGKLAETERNPARCLVCHRADPRPNWESYDQWPGVFGSRDDALAEDEFEPFKKFITAMDGHPRYGLLRASHLKSVPGRSSHYGRLPKEPNITFTHRVSRMNYKRVARLIMATPDYDRFKYAILAYFGSHDGERFSAYGYVPPGLEGITAYYTKEQMKEAAAIAKPITVRADVDNAMAFRSLFESRGIDTSDWFLNFRGGLTNTFLNGTPWEWQLLEALTDRDPELKALLQPGSTNQIDTNKTEDAANAKFKANRAQVTLTSFETDSAVPERIWNRTCKQCHEMPELAAATKAPQFGFAAARQKPRFAELVNSGAMPPDHLLTPSEKRRLLAP